MERATQSHSSGSSSPPPPLLCPPHPVPLLTSKATKLRSKFPFFQSSTKGQRMHPNTTHADSPNAIFKKKKNFHGVFGKSIVLLCFHKCLWMANSTPWRLVMSRSAFYTRVLYGLPLLLHGVSELKSEGGSRKGKEEHNKSGRGEGKGIVA